MKYAAGLTMIGTGGLLLFAAFTNQSAWTLFRDTLTGVKTPTSSDAPYGTGTIPKPTPSGTLVPVGSDRPMA